MFTKLAKQTITFYLQNHSSTGCILFFTVTDTGRDCSFSKERSSHWRTAAIRSMPVAVQADEQAFLPNNSVSARPQTGDNRGSEVRTALVGRQKPNATSK